MTEPEEGVKMPERVGRLGNGQRMSPKHMRFAGGYCLFAFAVLAGINVYSWQDRELWPKALILAPSVLLLGLWMLLDAKALAADARRHQQVILWACIGVGTATGLAIMHALTGSFF